MHTADTIPRICSSYQVGLANCFYSGWSNRREREKKLIDDVLAVMPHAGHDMVQKELELIDTAEQ
jgi:hypothetical protein